MKFNKWQLDCTSTILGLVGGVPLILTGNNIVPLNFALIASGTAIILLGYTAQRPADARPTTKEIEEYETHHGRY